MSNELSQLVNSPVLWTITIAALGGVMCFSGIYLAKSIRAGKEMGISMDEMKVAVKTSCVTSIGPSIVIMLNMISLLMIAGAPTALLRLGVIGSIDYEMLCAGLATDAYGTTVSVGNMTPHIFQTMLFVMAVGCIGWLVIPSVFCNSFDKVLSRMNGKGNNVKKATLISTAALLGCYAYVQAPYLAAVDASTVAMTAGFIAMLVIQRFQKKTNKKWLYECGLMIAMIIGMLCGGLL